MSDFGLRIGIEGERDFKAALREINQSFKVLGSEMQLVTSQFDKNDKSVQSLTSRNAVLRKEIDTQKDKIDTLKSALDNASTSFGENDSRTKNWQIQLNGMERELGDSFSRADYLPARYDCNLPRKRRHRHFQVHRFYIKTTPRTVCIALLISLATRRIFRNSAKSHCKQCITFVHFRNFRRTASRLAVQRIGVTVPCRACLPDCTCRGVVGVRTD